MNNDIVLSSHTKEKKIGQFDEKFAGPESKLAFSRNAVLLGEVHINQSLNNPLHHQGSQRKLDEFLESGHAISFRTRYNDDTTNQELSLVSSISLWIPSNVRSI